ncbi:TRAPP subunit [Scheffersomyces spartinae]|uniref:TRAPP subunit n=1 Tax=Scheffersomyces spartinae TaxID=45513 RepID=A0A9P7VCR9_9ASCO|nr:TRAPP subunit [Scheffersomyces spartinae]KAG7195576.1 TRAPP subunit [Scheffersomyces spartinae]
MASYYFTIIGTLDRPLYELEFASFKNPTAQGVPGKSQFSASVKEILPFIANSSLDVVEDAQWNSNQFHLGKIDAFFGLQVNGYITQGNIKFLLCYETPTNANLALHAKQDDTTLKQFFNEVNDLYVKCLLNPFYSVNDAITSPDFDLRVKLIVRKYL